MRYIFVITGIVLLAVAPGQAPAQRDAADPREAPSGRDEPRPAYAEDFEGYLPGQLPNGWSVKWGKPPEDEVIGVTNERAASGKRALVIERRMDGQYAYGFDFHKRLAGAEDWVEVRYAFMTRGSALDAGFSFYLRSNWPTNANVLEVRQTKGRFMLIPKTGTRKQRRDNRPRLGDYESGRWFRVTLWAPLGKASGEMALARLERLRPDGRWEPTGARARTRVKIPDPFGHLFFIPPPGARLYVDDVRIVTDSEPPDAFRD
jgi:hypothetical protein